MTSTANDAAAAAEATAASREDDATSNLAGAVRAWFGDFRPMLGAMSDLATSEARLAATSLALILAAAAGLVVMATSAWLSVAAATVFWLSDQPAAWISLASWIGLASAVGAVAAYAVARYLTRFLGFPLTRHALFGQAPTASAAEARESRPHAEGEDR